ncbi:zinc finger and BTB domain-containing protein 24-like [Contarinia nasturtii]|uniref:zinc finger and BTB domain-containing protein 24-like n=1 Tax=Contarinia nasturtii TaxID=265458 RepID=UPI0012D49FC9|nr:zinc finger and BTB domain-containing protein 24-like [Contarinia nasturtii]XP_031626907.1 zinc finger and BTB domain-containing protein 24-like [Contarinia nasturtii]
MELYISTPIDKHTKRRFSEVAHDNRLSRRSLNRPFECSYCSQSFKVHSNLLYHEQIHKWNQHNLKDDAKPFECAKCGLKFFQKVELDRHGLVHWERNLQKCKWCSKKYEVEQHLQWHERIHQWIDSLDQPFEYDEFGVTWQSETGDESIVVGEATFSNSPNSSIGNEPTKSNPRKRSHSPVYKIQPKFDCFVCKQRFTSKQNLQSHKLIHVNKTLCSFCGETFSENDKKITHEITVHPQPSVMLMPLENDNDLKNLLNKMGIKVNGKDDVKTIRPKRRVKITQMIPVLKKAIGKRKFTQKQILVRRSQRGGGRIKRKETKLVFQREGVEEKVRIMPEEIDDELKALSKDSVDGTNSSIDTDHINRRGEMSGSDGDRTESMESTSFVINRATHMTDGGTMNKLGGKIKNGNGIERQIIRSIENDTELDAGNGTELKADKLNNPPASENSILVETNRYGVERTDDATATKDDGTAHKSIETYKHFSNTNNVDGKVKSTTNGGLNEENAIEFQGISTRKKSMELSQSSKRKIEPKLNCKSRRTVKKLQRIKQNDVKTIKDEENLLVAPIVEQIENEAVTTKSKTNSDILNGSDVPSSQQSNNNLSSFKNNVCPDVDGVKQQELIHIKENLHDCRKTRSWQNQFNQIERTKFKVNHSPTIKLFRILKN